VSINLIFFVCCKPDNLLVSIGLEIAVDTMDEKVVVGYYK
jgi:hypothetical protein